MSTTKLHTEYHSALVSQLSSKLAKHDWNTLRNAMWQCRTPMRQLFGAVWHLRNLVDCLNYSFCDDWIVQCGAVMIQCRIILHCAVVSVALILRINYCCTHFWDNYNCRKFVNTILQYPDSSTHIRPNICPYIKISLIQRTHMLPSV